MLPGGLDCRSVGRREGASQRAVDLRDSAGLDGASCREAAVVRGLGRSAALMSAERSGVSTALE